MSVSTENRTRAKYTLGRRFGVARSQKDRTIQFLATNKLSEIEVGITEYVNPNLPGFTGIIKARYSDFHVNEINNANEVAKLTDIQIPKDFYKNVEDDGESNIDKLKRLLSEDVLKQLHDMVDSEDDLKAELDAETLSKEERCSIYDGLRSIFGTKIVANTVTVDGKKMMLFKKGKKGDGKVNNRRKWPSDKGEYVYFVVYKEQLDTMEACFRIADCLKINASNFTYAGVKDRRAKTTQWFCAHKVHPDILLSKTKFIHKLHIGNLSFHSEPLQIGQLKGNHFRVALRNITAEDNLISDAMDALIEKGFINYYGLQRFGNDREVPTYEIGVKLLLGNFKEACDLILKVRSSDDPNSEITQAKRVYSETKDCQIASKQFRKLNNNCIESKLLLGLTKNNPNDYVNSLENIPRNMRLLYIHAFQSLVWNTMASLRIMKFGFQPIEGDIVFINENDETEDIDNIKILTKDDLKLYTIYDVVLPLPGYDIKYPENELKDSYKEMLHRYGLTLEMPKQSVKTYTLSGAYRKIMCRVTNTSWKTIRYDHPDDTLIRSDYEELIGDEEPIDKPEARYKALIVEFTLPQSGYATMVLREVLKMDTSSTAHAKLNTYHVPTDSSKEEPHSTSGGELQDTVTPSSLLADTEKYEEFKRQVFGMEEETEEPPKRKLDDIDDNVSSKKSKLSSDET